LFGRHILPEFAERDENLVRQKQARLEPIVEAALARRPAPPAPDLTDYEIPAIIKTMVDRSGDEKLKQLVDSYAAERAAGLPDRHLEGS
jgi:hypothetical protein